MSILRVDTVYDRGLSALRFSRKHLSLSRGRTERPDPLVGGLGRTCVEHGPVPLAVPDSQPVVTGKAPHLPTGPYRGQ